MSASIRFLSTFLNFKKGRSPKSLTRKKKKNKLTNSEQMNYNNSRTNILTLQTSTPTQEHIFLEVVFRFFFWAGESFSVWIWDVFDNSKNSGGAV